MGFAISNMQLRCSAFAHGAAIPARYTGEGDIPSLDPEVWEQTSARYIEIYERLTGLTFERGEYPADQRIIDTVSALEIPA